MQDFGYLDYSLKVVDTEKRIRKEGRKEREREGKKGGRKEGRKEGQKKRRMDGRKALFLLEHLICFVRGKRRDVREYLRVVDRSCKNTAKGCSLESA